MISLVAYRIFLDHIAVHDLGCIVESDFQLFPHRHWERQLIRIAAFPRGNRENTAAVPRDGMHLSLCPHGQSPNGVGFLSIVVGETDPKFLARNLGYHRIHHCFFLARQKAHREGRGRGLVPDWCPVHHYPPLCQRNTQDVKRSLSLIPEIQRAGINGAPALQRQTSGIEFYSGGCPVGCPGKGNGCYDRIFFPG